jgi:hypothetical protein
LLRWILVEAAVAESRHEGELRERFRRIAQRRGPKIARVALARHLLTIVYHVLAEGTPHHAQASSEADSASWVAWFVVERARARRRAQAGRRREALAQRHS